MNVRAMQLIDYWVGVPLCVVCSVLQFFLKLLRGVQSPASVPNKILFIELSEMGSAILAYPMLVRAREYYPHAERHFLIFRRNVESIEILGALDPQHIHVIEDTSLIRFLLSTLRIVWKLRKLGFDVVIDLELFSRCTALLSFLIGAPCKVGFHNYTEEGLFRGTFLSHRVWYNPHFHISQNFMALLEAIRAPADELPLVKIPISADGFDLPRIDVAREAHLVGERIRVSRPDVQAGVPLILLNPDPGLLELRGWGLASYRALTEELLAQSSELFIGVIGLERSSHYFTALREGVSQPERLINLCGTTESLRELVGLFSFAAVLVTNDSGPAHFAPLAGLRSVVLYGPETPERYSPLGGLSRNLSAYLACSPCFTAQNHRHSVCRNNRCMQAIPVQQVLNETAAALAEWSAQHIHSRGASSC
jgi:ADP-heptose:LPS heptosyltransferase